MKKIITACLMYGIISSYGQEWHVVGDTVASDWEVGSPYITLDKTNIPYITFFSNQASPKTRPSVRRFNGTEWTQVGPNIDTAWVLTTTLDFDSSNRPWIAYCDQSHNSKATVKFFDGTQWIAAGGEGFTADAASYTSIKIAPDNTPYLAFRDKSKNYSASVMKFNGSTWSYVGTPGFSPQTQGAGALYLNLEIDKNGILYVAFCDMSNNFKITVMKYNGTAWSFVGNSTLTEGGSYTSIVLDSHGTPFVSYTDGHIKVKRFNGTAWETVGKDTSVAGDTPYLSIDKFDNLYLGYTGDGGKARAMIYKSGVWKQAGSEISPSSAGYVTTAVDTNGAMFICYQDFTNRYKDGWGPFNCATVQKLENSAVGINETKSIGFLWHVFPNPSTGVVNVNYNCVKPSKGIIKITNASGQMFYMEDFFGSFNKEINLSKYGKGIYFIEIKTGEATERKKVILE